MVFVEMDPFKELGFKCNTDECHKWLGEGKSPEELAEGVCSISRDWWDWKESRCCPVMLDAVFVSLSGAGR